MLVVDLRFDIVQDWTCLLHASRDGHVRVVELLLEAHASVNMVDCSQVCTFNECVVYLEADVPYLFGTIPSFCYCFSYCFNDF